MTKFFNKFKKTLFLAHFWSIFPILGGKFFPPKNPAVIHNFIWVSSTCQNLEKTDDTIPRKCPDGGTKGRKDRCQNSEKTDDTIQRKRPDGGTKGRKDRRTDPISYDPSGYRRGSKKMPLH